MAQNLEYIYILRDRYSKKLASITKKQLAFTEAYKKSMGKVNAAATAHGRIIARNTKLYNANKQAMSRVKGSLDTLTQSQGRYARSSVRRLTTLNSEWRKHGAIVRAQQARQRTRVGGVAGAASVAARGGGGVGLAGMATGVGGAFFMKSTLDTATSFYQNLNTLRAYGKGVDLDVMKKKAMEWGITTQFSAVQASGAMAEAAKNNMTQNEILAAMPGNIALAASGQMDLVSAMRLSTDVVNQFGKAHSNLDVADFLAAASKSPSTIAQIGAALQNVGTTAFQAGIPLKATTKWLMALGETGLRGEVGGTMLMNMIQQMKKMSPKLKKGFATFLKGTGVSLSEIINLETKQFVDPDKFTKLLMNANKKQMGALTTAMEIRGGKALGSIAALSGKQFDKYTEILDNFKGSALEIQKKVMEGLPGGLKLFDSALETTKLVMIDSFVGPLSIILRNLAKFLVYLSKNHSWVLKLTFVVIGLVTALGLLAIASWAVGGAFLNLKIATLFLAHTFAWTTIKVFLFKTMLIAVVAVARIAAFGVKLWTAAQWLLNAALTANPIGLIIVGVAALAALFVYAWHKTGSWTNALKFMGGVLIKSVLEPVNLVILAIRGLLYIASKIPGAVGRGFGAAYEKTTGLQERMNLTLTGNKSLTAAGMIYDLSQKGAGSSTWMKQQAQQTKRSEYVTANPAMAPTSRMGKAMAGFSPSYSPGMMGYVSPEGVSKQSATMEQMTKQAASGRTDVSVKPVEVKGVIKVIADKGIKIKDMNFIANTGGNMYTLGGAH